MFFLFITDGFYRFDGHGPVSREEPGQQSQYNQQDVGTYGLAKSYLETDGCSGGRGDAFHDIQQKDGQ